MKKIAIVALAAMSLVSAARAGINVQWSAGWGFYDFGAADTASLNPADGFLFSGQSAILQLIYSPDANASAVDPGNVGGGYVTGGEIVLETRTITDGIGGYDSFGFNSSIPPAYFNATFTAGFVYVRVFQDTTPAADEHYYNSGTLALADRVSGEPTAQVLQINSDPNNNGDALNLTIVPEPATFAFLGIGGLLIAARRMRRS